MNKQNSHLGTFLIVAVFTAFVPQFCNSPGSSIRDGVSVVVGRFVALSSRFSVNVFSDVIHVSGLASAVPVPTKFCRLPFSCTFARFLQCTVGSLWGANIILE